MNATFNATDLFSGPSSPLPLNTFQHEREDFAASILITTEALMESMLSGLKDGVRGEADDVLNENLIGKGSTPNNSHADQTERSPYLPFELYATPIVCILGIIMNVLNLLVLSEGSLKESPYAYLTAMAILCSASLVMTLVSFTFRNKYLNEYFSQVYYYNIYFPCVNICTNSTMFLTATMTIERFLIVRFPLWARAKCDRRSAKVKIIIIMVLTALLNVPRFLLYKVMPTPNKPDHYHYQFNTFRSADSYVALTWFYSIIIQVIPLTILCLANIYLVCAVHRARRLRMRLQIRNNMEEEWSREQTRLTITLISIVFFFIICIMPAALADLNVAHLLFANGRTRAEFQKSHFYILLHRVSNLLVFCQQSFNFVLFSAFNYKFVTVFKRMLKRWMEAITSRGVSRRSQRSAFRLVRTDTSASSDKHTRSSATKSGPVSHCTSRKEDSRVKMAAPEKYG